MVKVLELPGLEGIQPVPALRPGLGKKKDNDYTVILVIGLGPDENYYLIDGIRSRLNLTERTNKVFNFHRRYHPLLWIREVRQGF